MQVIKPVLILCFVVLLLVVFRHRGRAGLRAGARLVALGLGLAAVVFVVEPGILQYLAGLLGVTRGTDLLLYALVIVFTLTTMGLYFAQRGAQSELQQLARRVALSDAVLQSGPPGRPQVGPAPDPLELVIDPPPDLPSAPGELDRAERRTHEGNLERWRDSTPGRESR